MQLGVQLKCSLFVSEDIIKCCCFLCILQKHYENKSFILYISVTVKVKEQKRPSCAAVSLMPVDVN